MELVFVLVVETGFAKQLLLFASYPECKKSFSIDSINYLYCI